MHHLTTDQITELRDRVYTLTQVERIPDAEHELTVLMTWISNFKAPEDYSGRTASIFRRLARREARAYLRHHLTGIHPYAVHLFETWKYGKLRTFQHRTYSSLSIRYDVVWQKVRGQEEGYITEEWPDEVSSLWWMVKKSERLKTCLMWDALRWPDTPIRTGMLQRLGGFVEDNEPSLTELLVRAQRQREAEGSSLSDRFSRAVFPLVRRAFGGLVANELVRVQPMPPVAGRIFQDPGFVYAPYVPEAVPQECSEDPDTLVVTRVETVPVEVHIEAPPPDVTEAFYHSMREELERSVLEALKIPRDMLYGGTWVGAKEETGE